MSLALIANIALSISALSTGFMVGMSIVVFSIVGFVSGGVNLASLCYLSPKFKRLPEADNTLKNFTLFLALFNCAMLAWLIYATIVIAELCQGENCAMAVVYALCSCQGIITLIGLGLAVVLRSSAVEEGYSSINL